MKRIRTTSDRALRHISRLEMAIKGRPYVFDVQKELSLTADTNEDILLTHTERFAFWRRMLATTMASRRQLEQELEEEIAKYTLAIKMRNKQDGVKMSERDVSFRVRIHSAIKPLRTKLDECASTEDTLRMMVEAFDHRRSVILKLVKVTHNDA